MNLGSATGKSSRLVIFLRFFAVSTVLVYLPMMFLMKEASSFDEPYFTGWFFTGWFGICCFFMGFMWVWMKWYFDNVFHDSGPYWQWRAAGRYPLFDWFPWPGSSDPWTHRMAIGTPPAFDWCPTCIAPLGQNFGNQCSVCGEYWDNCYEDQIGQE